MNKKILNTNIFINAITLLSFLVIPLILDKSWMNNDRYFFIDLLSEYHKVDKYITAIFVCLVLNLILSIAGIKNNTKGMGYGIIIFSALSVLFSALLLDDISKIADLGVYFTCVGSVVMLILSFCLFLKDAEPRRYGSKKLEVQKPEPRLELNNAGLNGIIFTTALTALAYLFLPLISMSDYRDTLTRGFFDIVDKDEIKLIMILCCLILNIILAMVGKSYKNRGIGIAIMMSSATAFLLIVTKLIPLFRYSDTTGAGIWLSCVGSFFMMYTSFHVLTASADENIPAETEQEQITEETPQEKAEREQEKREIKELQQKKAKENAKHLKRIGVIVFSSAIAISTLVFLYKGLIAPNNKYKVEVATINLDLKMLSKNHELRSQKQTLEDILARYSKIEIPIIGKTKKSTYIQEQIKLTNGRINTVNEKIKAFEESERKRKAEGYYKVGEIYERNGINGIVIKASGQKITILDHIQLALGEWAYNENLKKRKAGKGRLITEKEIKEIIASPSYTAIQNYISKHTLVKSKYKLTNMCYWLARKKDRYTYYYDAKNKTTKLNRGFGQDVYAVWVVDYDFSKK